MPAPKVEINNAKINFGPYSKNISLQIAHTFEKGKLTKALEGSPISYDPEKFIGEGANPDFLYLDI